MRPPWPVIAGNSTIGWAPRASRPEPMSPRGRRIGLLLAAVVVLLFSGRWLASFLTDLWWARAVSAAAAEFAWQWRLLRLSLELTGIAVAGAWFVGHLLVFSRAVHGVTITRRVGGLEI